jgi:hypothetical protein
MGEELTQVLCPRCGTSGESDSRQSRWQCTKCGNGFFLRRCAVCTRVSYVDGLQGFHMPWPCTWCGRYNTGFSQNQDPATATVAELATERAHYGSAANLPVLQIADEGSERALSVITAVVPVGPAVESPRPEPVPAAPTSGPRHSRRVALSVGAVVAGAAIAFALLMASGPRAAGMADKAVGPGPATRVVQVAGSAGSVDLEDVPGQLVIVGTSSGPVTLTGQVNGTNGAPVVVSRLDRAADVLVVSIRCASAAPCTQNLRLAVPGDTSVVVRQSSGQIGVSGLAGALSVTGDHLNVSASGLRSPSLTAVITSGRLSAAFVVPPRQVSVTLTSAQATVQLPGHVAYRVDQQVMSGFLHATVPEDRGAPRTVNARLQSSELELLAS